MSKLDRIVVVLSLIEGLKAKGSWCGETHIQKAVYLLEKLTKLPLGYHFKFYKYGPYSFELHDELISMIIDSLLQRKVNPAPYGPGLLPAEGWKALKLSWSEFIQRYSSQIEFISDVVGKKSVTELERLTTALYVRRIIKGLEPRARLVMRLKPHIRTREEAKKAVREADRLKEAAV